MNRLLNLFVLVIVCFFVIPGIATAQYDKKLRPEDSLALTKAAAIADTGRMIPGYRDLKAYNTPGYCRALMPSVESYIWRSGEKDTLPRGVTDTLPTAVIEKGRQCIAPFTPQTVADYELYNYLIVASVIKDTTLMREIVRQVTESAKLSKQYKIGFLYDAARLGGDGYNPGLSKFVWSILEELKTYGNEAATSVINVYDIIKSNYAAKFDTTSFLAIGKERDNYISHIPDEALPNKAELKNAIYRDSLFLVWFNMPADYADQIKRLTYLATEARKDDPFSLIEREMSEFKPTFIDKLPSEMELVAAFPSTASAVPEKGKVTVYYRLMSGNANNKLPAILAKLLRLQKKYGPEKLDVVVVTAIEGSMWGSPPLEPEAEAKLHGWYFRQYHDLPFTILVNNRDIAKHRVGRVMRDKPLFDKFYGDGKRNVGYIVGKDGTIQAFEVFMGAETVVEKYIERELAK